ncbi:MAG: metal-dependent hydrolase [Candidatus Thermoplasmatota archaeon]|nr:metal-dependent hydrolase [Candidatus Thermoplasmatota archaeon]MBS3789931.1 metal-dependent hydrolase [Candidatus Thermoplasmatota archaeon]
MNWKGHAGLSLLISSLLMIPFGLKGIALGFIIITVLFSSLPDSDLVTPLEHRSLTHNVGFGLIFAAVIGSIIGYLAVIYVEMITGILVGIMIMLAIAGGVFSHLLGDIIAGWRYDSTPWKINPLLPFSSKSIGYGIFMATDEKVNYLFLKVGILTFLFYISFGIFRIYSGLH